MSNPVYIRELIDKHQPDCLQEHWLLNVEQEKLSTMHPDYYFAAKSVNDTDHISPQQRPHGYGGVCTLWKKSVLANPQPDGSESTQVILLGADTIVANTYLPC